MRLGRWLLGFAVSGVLTGCPSPGGGGGGGGPGGAAEIQVKDLAVSVVEDGKLDVKLDVISEAGAPEITIDKKPAHGALSGSGLAYTYTPEADYNGEDTIAFTATLDGASQSGTVTITVKPVNDAPAYTPGGDVTVFEDAGPQSFDWATGVAAGPVDEETQTLTFTVTTDNPTLFSTAPAIDDTGKLTFTPAADANGTAKVTVALADDGGTADGGEDAAPGAAFTITVTPVNDPPRFTAGSAPIVAEDAGAQSFTGWASAIAAGPADESGQTYAFTVTSDNPALFSAAPAISTAGDLTFTPAADANGSANLYIILSDDGTGANTSAVQVVGLTVSAVNDAPSFTAGANVTVNEDSGGYAAAWATNLSAGPANEASQAVTFTASTAQGSLFAVAPSINAAGQLSFTPAANANGVATVTVRAYDDGGTAFGGVNASASANFTITINAVNDAPSFSDAGNPVVSEDVGAVSLANWASGVVVGPSDEAAQTYNYSVTTDTPSLFSAAPAVSIAGTLSFTPAANANGNAKIYVRLQDSGGTANGGVDTSTVHLATITVTPVNDAPSFTAGSNVAVNEDSGAYSAAWASAIIAGPADESAQAVTFAVTTAQSGLFAIQPAVSASGQLTFTPSPNANGVATVTVRAYDNGGTAGGGVNASGTSNFTITINAVNDAPSFTAGSNVALNEDSGAYSAAWASAISPGPSDESAQSVTFSATTAQASLFAVQPAVSASGQLTFTPAADANGVATVSVRAYDNGGTALGGVNASVTMNFTITINAVNDAPSFTGGSNVAVNEDSGAYAAAWASAISAGPANESGQAVTFAVSTAQTGLFAVQPAVNAAGQLSFTPAADANGVATVTVRAYDDGGTALGGVNASGTSNFTITVNAVNDAPSFTLTSGTSVLEDGGPASVISFANAMSVGPADESGQTYAFTVTTDTPGLFSAAPAISTAGTLSFTTAANAFGAAKIYVVMTDTGGTANGGQNASAKLSATITVNAVNDPPSFVKGANQNTAEDAGPVSVPSWATAISPGPGESGNVVFVITNDNPSLFSSAPTVSPSGTLSFTSAPDAYGVANLTVRLKDDGGGSDLSAAQTFSINVVGVNDAPSFTAGGNQTVAEDAGAQVVAGWATALSAGPTNEAWQSFSFTVTTTNPGLFAAGPSVDGTGALAFTPAADANGSATVYVTMRDNGGTAFGGVNTTAPQAFSITVTPVNDPPTYTAGGDKYVLDTAGAQSYPGWASNISVGPADESSQTAAFSLTNDSPGLFSVAPTVNTSGDLSFTPLVGAAGTATLVVTLTDSAGGFTSHGLTIVVDGVNDAPSFVTGGTVTVAEDSGDYGAVWATSISAGPGETGQAVDFVVTANTNPGLFSVLPAIASDGMLSFRPAPNANGAAYVTVHLHDDGGTAGGGVDISGDVVFKIDVTPVNDAPAYVNAGDVWSFEDAGVSVPGWAFGIDPGPGDEAGQVVSFVVTAFDPSFFSVQPAVDSSGTLTFTPASDRNGTTAITIKAVDDGGSAGGGVDASPETTISVNVQAVNDAPSFTGGGDLVIDEDDPLGFGMGTPWATGMSTGPLDEAWQTYAFDVTSGNPSLVSSIWMDPQGTLMFWLNPNQSGTATIYVTMTDSGGTNDGGANTAVQTFTMTVNPVNDPPHPNADSVAVSINSPAYFDPASNDWDPDGDPLAVTGYTTPAHGYLLESMGYFQYTPVTDYTGADSFIYFVTDGTTAVAQVVTLFVGPDTVPPAFVAGLSNPQDGALLNREQAFGAGIGGVAQLQPARFVFDDPFFDPMTAVVSVTWQGLPLVENTGFFVDRGASGQIAVWVDTFNNPPPPEGAPLTYTISNVADTYGNVGGDVNVSVWLDSTAPQATWLSSAGWPYPRLVLAFSEPIDPASLAGFVAEDSTNGSPITPDAVDGQGQFDYAQSGDGFYFVAGATVPVGHDVHIDFSAFTDAAGNPAEAATWNYTACCAPSGSPLAISAVEFVDRFGAVDASFTAIDFFLESFVAPAVVAGTDDLVRVVFDRALDPYWSYGSLRGDEMRPNSLYVDATLASTNVANDTLVFDPLLSNPSFTWTQRSPFRIGIDVHEAAGNSSGYWRNLTFALESGAEDVTAPTVNALIARRGDGAVPILRGEEALKIRFSELVQPAGVAAAVSMTSPGGPVPLVIELSNLQEVRLRAAGPDGAPAPWPQGDLTLNIGSIKDLSASGTPLVPVSFAVAVTPAATPAPMLLHASSAATLYTGNDLYLSFSDRMSPASFVDTGAPASRGYAVEEQWGSAWIPAKVPAVRSEGLDTAAVIRFSLGLYPGAAPHAARIRWLAGLKNIDGVPIDLGSAAPVTFFVAAPPTGETTPSVHDVFADFQEFGPDLFTFGGMPIESRASFGAQVYDPDAGDNWQLSVVTAGGMVATPPSTSQNPFIDLYGSQIDPLFPPGASTPFMLAVSDAAGHTVSILQQIYRPSTATLTQAAPVVTAGSAPGTFVFTGQVLDPVDAAAIEAMGVVISVVDTSVFPYDAVDIAGFFVGQVYRNADGSLDYAYEIPADAALPPLPPPYAYLAAAIGSVPYEIDTGGRDMMFFSAGSAPFAP